MNIAGNAAKYLSYKLAFGRMRAAIEAGYPLEAVAIAESIITDRLLSFANHHGARLEPSRTTLGPALRKARDSSEAVDTDLFDSVGEWAKQRNEVLHSIAKSGQGEGPRISAEKFLAHADHVARTGLHLATEVKNWHRRQMNRSKVENG
jgi:hypothetical protein